MSVGAETKKRMTAPYVLSRFDPYSSEFDAMTNHEKEHEQFKHESKAAVVLAMDGEADALN